MTYTLLTMLFLHGIADYNLQGTLATLKRKETWENQPGNESNYIAALFMHSFMWSFVVMLPIALNMLFDVTPLFCAVFVANTAVHMLTDHLKANVKCINLVEDQAIHIVQILLTFGVLELW